MEIGITARERHRLVRHKTDLNEVRFYHPLPKFPNVSITGGECYLNCRHCGGHYLKQMYKTDTPEKLKEFCRKLDDGGGTGILISGGSTPDGRVPLERFYPTLEWIKEDTGLIVNVHTGLLDEDRAEAISSTGIDVASVDVVGSRETIRGVYGLDAGPEDYINTLVFLQDAGVPHVAPHICVGLDHGRIVGEHDALKVMSDINPEVIVILGLIPTAETPMENIDPPSVEDIMMVVSKSRELCPYSDIALGCMRSRIYKKTLEERAIRAGVNRIAIPSKSTIEKAERDGFEVLLFDACCAIPRSLEGRALRVL